MNVAQTRTETSMTTMPGTVSATGKVGYVLKMYPRFSETFILGEILELERQGVAVEIFSLKKPDDGRFHADLADVQAPVTYIPESPVTGARALAAAHRKVFRAGRWRYLTTLSGALRRRRWGAFKRFLQAGYLVPRLQERGIDHIHAHFASSATSVASYVQQLAGTSFSFTAHAKDIYADGVAEDVLARKLRRAAFCVTVSDYNQRFLAPLAGATPVHRIYNGLDLARFSPPAVPRDDPPLILGVGRLVEKKGFLDLVRACALLRDRGLPFRCLIVGKGPEEQRLRAEIARLGLSAQVTLPGPLPRGRLLTLYPRATVFVAPCIIGADGNRDGLPTVLIEAMALGVPVVATPVTGIPELVRDGETGLLAPPGDPAALADRIGRLVGDADLAAELAAAGRRAVGAAFDITVNVGALRRLFEAARGEPAAPVGGRSSLTLVGPRPESAREGTQDAARLSVR